MDVTLLPTGMQRRVVWYTLTYVSEECTASVFKVVPSFEKLANIYQTTQHHIQHTVTSAVIPIRTSNLSILKWLLVKQVTM
jgi:hypothetical protein